MRKTLPLFVFLASFSFLLFFHARAQYVNPNVNWTFSAKQISESDFDLIVEAQVAPGYHLYSQFIEEGGPVPTAFTFEKAVGCKRIGKVKESGNRKEAPEPMFENMLVVWFEDQAVFTQRIRLLQPEAEVKGYVTFMTCNDKLCDFPSDQVFEFKVKGKPALPQKTDTAAKSDAKSKIDSAALATTNSSNGSAKEENNTAALPAVTETKPLVNEDVRDLSNWATFLKGFGIGLLALLFPCVWPVIPLTVSFFLKHESKKRKGRMNAIIYALSIVVIFVVLGILVSLLTTGQKLNELSTGWFFNMLWFALFFLFGLSFLGVFEITLPSAWINKTEKMSERGGLMGIFFMAFTLVLVSFSCTLPFIGNLIDIVTRDGDFIKPLIGFAAFGLALGLPFGVFALFPAGLKKLPKSGNWMHTLKVTFGFLEIALSFIYLSKVDMAYHWNVLSRDIFLAVWIILSGVLGFYLLGKVKLSSEDDDSHISVSRLLVAVFFLAFALYMTPGLWGSPLKPLSGFLPNYSEFILTAEHKPDSEKSLASDEKKYQDLFEAPLGLDLYFDYDEALAHAKTQNKPLFIDFTGWGCVNCRKMEKSVWPNPSVLKRLKEDFITASLYVDDKTRLPANERYYSEGLKKEVKTLGDKNFDIQYSRYKMGAQPYYILLDSEGNLLNQPRGYTPDVNEYVAFLDEGLEKFKDRQDQVALLR